MNNFYFFKFINLVRILNSIKVYASYYFSALLKTPLVWGKPIGISIEPSAVCNLRCPECPTGKGILTRETGLLKYENFVKYLSNFERHIFWLTLYFQGEPYLNKEFNKMVAYAKSKKIFVQTSTNAHFLNPENCEQIVDSGLDQLIVSLDGADVQTYCKYRIGGDFDKVIQGIKNLIDAKQKLKSRTPFVQLQFLVFKYNEHQLSRIKEIADELLIDEVVFKSAQIYDFHNATELIPDNTAYSRYITDKHGAFVLKKKIKNRCKRMWQSLVITWRGDIVPCCFDKDADYKFGNLNKEPFSVIQHSKAYNGFRKKALHQRKGIPICNNCIE